MDITIISHIKPHIHVLYFHKSYHFKYPQFILKESWQFKNQSYTYFSNIHNSYLRNYGNSKSIIYISIAHIAQIRFSLTILKEFKIP